MARTVFVLDGRSRAALSIIRSLGRKGIDVIVGEAFRCASFHSKYVRKTVVYPKPDLRPNEFLEFLTSFLKRQKVDVLMPVRDHTTGIVCENSNYLKSYTNFVAPPTSSFSAARDKSETVKLARALGIPHPRTLLPSEIQDDLRELRDCFDVPLVLKPCVSSGSRGILVVNKWQDLTDSIRQVSSAFGFPLVQEFIPHGGGFGVSALVKEGDIKAFFTHKRIREFPPSGGPSTLREGVRYPEIEKYAFDLLKELKWNGPAMVEFRIDKRDGVPKLMEINPRFWGSLQTAVFSGVDFPYLLFQLAMNGDVEPHFDYPVGKKVRWLLFGDLLWYFKSPHKLKNLREFLRFRDENVGYDEFDANDLGPVFGLFFEAILSLFSPTKIAHVFKRGW